MLFSSVAPRLPTVGSPSVRKRIAEWQLAFAWGVTSARRGSGGWEVNNPVREGDPHEGEWMEGGCQANLVLLVEDLKGQVEGGLKVGRSNCRHALDLHDSQRGKKREGKRGSGQIGVCVENPGRPRRRCG